MLRGLLGRGRRDDHHRVSSIQKCPIAPHPSLPRFQVSRNLHRWIDLIFGCKQRGLAAGADQEVLGT